MMVPGITSWVIAVYLLSYINIIEKEKVSFNISLFSIFFLFCRTKKQF